MATLFNDVISNNLTTALAATPAGNDSVILRRGSERYNAGVNFAATDLAVMHLRPEYSGDIDESNLIFVCNQAGAGRVTVEWSGRLVRMASNATASVWARLTHNPAQGGLALYQTVTVTAAFINGGSASFADDAIVTTLNQAGGSCDLRESANASTTLNVRGGTLKLDRDATTLNVEGTGSVTVGNILFTPTTTNIRGGSIIYRNTGASGGALNGYAGVLDFRSCSTAVTFASGELHPGLTILKPRGVTIDTSALTDYGAKVVTE